MEFVNLAHAFDAPALFRGAGVHRLGLFAEHLPSPAERISVLHRRARREAARQEETPP